MRAARRPGQPLAALGLIMTAWIIARIALWQGPSPVGQALAMADEVRRPPPAAGPAAVATGTRSQAEALPFGASFAAEAPLATPLSHRYDRGGGPAVPVEPVLQIAPATVPFVASPLGPTPGSVEPAATPLVREPSARARAVLARWSGGGWLLLRGGAAGALALGPGVGRYGGSQAGAVLSYSLGRSERRPALYVRTTAALRRAADRELALGGSARPFAVLPVRAQLELRARESNGRIRFSPAALAVSEFPPLHLPARFKAEGYLQAGYVGGDFATAFIGGDLRIDRPLAELEGARIRAGAGVWGGAQQGAAALDVGPGVTLETDLGGLPARLALDYRVRVAGGAEPRSGLALTLSTGF